MKRSLSIDFLRGFAIWMMIVFHVFIYSYKDFNKLTDLDYLLDLPPVILIFVAILIQLSTWAGLFILISMCVNVMAMQHRINKQTSLKTLRNRQIFTGSLILLLGYLVETFISYNGFLGYSLTRREVAWDGLHHGLLTWKALHIIGSCVIISSLILYQLYKNDGHLQVRRNISIFISLSVLVLVMTPVINWLIHSYIYSWWNPDDNTTQFNWPPDSFAELLLRMVLIGLNGYLEPLFPYLSTAFIGMVFGVFLSQENPPKKFPKYAMICGICCYIIGFILIWLGFDSPPINFRREIPWFMLAIGGQIWALGFLTWIVEFKGHVRTFKYMSTFWRRWGMAALSIYCLQILDYPVKYLVYLMTGQEAHKRESLSLAWTLIMIILTIIWFDLLLRLWAKYDFKYSFEWMVIHLTTKSQSVISERTQVKAVIYDVEPIVFNKPK